ncbi:TolC family protein [[Clostridium] symbiosum]|uniref:TolC family protein n=1 Tax=Clostridium symbiosum TaxID=1512 RepID=UPI001D086069|nr:TolC family protein [[Clostridium] symbiosum]MCB6607576.1 TolC family protein [[Clostridium] symbiosum]MCB6930678.1 TolC family protein [[Clostridium] symbiosum]
MNRRIAGWAAAAGTAISLLYQLPVQAASGPLISGLEEAGEAEGPALSENWEEAEDSKETAAVSDEALNDNLIEYIELEQLIRTGNSSAVNTQKSYENSLEIYQAAYDSLISAKRDMINKADELEDEGAAEELIANYDQNAKILSSSAGQMKRSINSLNSATSQASINRTINSLVKSAQTLMYSCKQMEYQAGAAEKRVEAQNAAYELASSRRQAGLITETELLEAEKSLLNAQASLQSTKDSADKLKRQLAVMIGKNADEIQIGEIPAVTQEELAGMNLPEDKQKAVIADSNVKSVKKSTATGDTARKLRRQQLSEAEGTASLTMDELYQAVTEAKQLYEGAAASYAAAEKDYGALQTKYRAGMINKSTYLSGEATWYTAIASYRSAEITFKQAVESYQWAIKGIS